jgi:galactokinase
MWCKYGGHMVRPNAGLILSPPDVARLRARLLSSVADRDPDSVRVVRAPGRVNLIGEHTDYNDGLVLPMAIGLEIRVASMPRADRLVRLELSDGERGEFDLDRPGAPRGSWVDYAAGVAIELDRRGVPLRGVDAVVDASLPAAIGLSSSAAFELALAWTLADAVPPPLSPLDLARAAQAAENDFVGVRCGLMDQAAVALGRRDAAVLLDCRSLEFAHVPATVSGHRWILIDSGSKRRLTESAYNARRAECEAAVAAIHRHDASVTSLRDVDAPMLGRYASALGDGPRRRAEHVVAENQRVVDAVSALQRGDAEALGDLLDASHASLRDLYEVSSPELDDLVATAHSVDGMVGARLTGAGFGGCVVALVHEGAVEDLRQAVQSRYGAQTGLRGTLHAISAVDGAGVVSED